MSCLLYDCSLVQSRVNLVAFAYYCLLISNRDPTATTTYFQFKLCHGFRRWLLIRSLRFLRLQFLLMPQIYLGVLLDVWNEEVLSLEIIEGSGAVFLGPVHMRVNDQHEVIWRCRRSRVYETMIAWWGSKLVFYLFLESPKLLFNVPVYVLYTSPLWIRLKELLTFRACERRDHTSVVPLAKLR